MADKNCIDCNVLMKSVVHNKLRCDGCKKEHEQEYNKRYLKSRYEKTKPLNADDCLINFETIINSGDVRVLSPTGFTKKSDISAITTTLLLKTKWFILLEKYSKINDLYEYVKDEYLKHYAKTKNASVEKFVFEHEFISQDVLKFFGSTKLKNDCGFTRKGFYNKQELIAYFLELVNELGFVPIYSEFIKNSKIKHTQYLSLLSEDKTWDSVVKSIVSPKQYEEYLKRVEERKIRVAKAGKSSQPVINEEVMEKEFKRTFDFCFKNYGSYPTRRLFNEISKYTDGLYRKRYKESWNKTVERYGYPTKNHNPSEKLALGMISKITGAKYVPQKTWEWLLSDKGKNLLCDGYYEELNLVVEFDGAQHRRPLRNLGGHERHKIQVKNDAQKDKLLKEHGIKLIRINSDEEWYKEEYLINKLIENKIPYIEPQQSNAN